MRIGKIFFVLTLNSLFAFSTSAQTDTEDCSPPHYGKIAAFYNEKKTTSYEYKTLDYLAGALKRCPNFVGHITYYTKEGTSVKKNLKYVNRIKQYLIEEKKISPERLIFEDYGLSKINYVDIFVTTKEIIPRKIKIRENQ